MIDTCFRLNFPCPHDGNDCLHDGNDCLHDVTSTVILPMLTFNYMEVKRRLRNIGLLPDCVSTMTGTLSTTPTIDMSLVSTVLTHPRLGQPGFRYVHKRIIDLHLVGLSR